MSKFCSIVATNWLGSSLLNAELMRFLRFVEPIRTHRSRGNDRIAACDWFGSTRSNMIVSERSPMSFPSVKNAPAYGELGSMHARLSEPTRR
jgi:hypothetical protein